MEKLFDALRERHPGYEPVDVRFLVNIKEVDGRSAASLDEELAKAIANAKEIPFDTVQF